MQGLISSIKRISKGTTESLNLSDIVFGRVVTLKPLTVKIEGIEEEILTSEFLDVAQNLQRKVFKLDISHQHSVFDKDPETIKEGDEIETIGFSDKALPKPIEIVINEGIKVNDTVIMVKRMGGQSFVVIDKLGNTNDVSEEIIIWS